MSKFTMEINLDNAAWRTEDDKVDTDALSLALGAVSLDAQYDNEGTIWDANGNRSGSWQIVGVEV